MTRLSSRERRSDDEAGFTLMELLIAIAITGIILVTMGFAVTQGFDNATQSKASIDRSILGNFAARYFAPDIASATFGTNSILTATTTPTARQCGLGTPVVDIQTTATTAVSYSVVPAAAGESLVRTLCSGTPGGTLTQITRQHIGTTDASLTASASCATATSCALTLSWVNPSTSITVSGTRWVNATTTTAP